MPQLNSRGPEDAKCPAPSPSGPSLYHLTITSADGHRDTITRLRKEICRTIGLNSDGPSVQPIDFASYLFAYKTGRVEPIGMIEFFFYDQCFRSFSESVYAQAADLRTLGSMSELVHVRSVVLDGEPRGSRAFLYLVAALVSTAARMGGLAVTAGTGVHNAAILALHRTAGMTPFGRYIVDGSVQQLSVLELSPLLKRASEILARGGVVFDDRGLQELRVRRKAGL